jgi:hypothetical protein
MEEVVCQFLSTCSATDCTGDCVCLCVYLGYRSTKTQAAHLVGTLLGFEGAAQPFGTPCRTGRPLPLPLLQLGRHGSAPVQPHICTDPGTLINVNKKSMVSCFPSCTRAHTHTHTNTHTHTYAYTHSTLEILFTCTHSLRSLSHPTST